MNHYLTFVALSVAVLVFPGPSTLLITANSLQRGRVVGFYTVAGGLLAMGVQLAVALIGLASVIEHYKTGFAVVRWMGALYLMYLGVQRWHGVSHSELRGRVVGNYGSAMIEGFVVALTNPGTMLFFVAFFPQFVSDAVPLRSQLALMATTFIVLTVMVDSSYVLLAARIGHRLQRPGRKQVRNRLAGALLIFASIALALLNI